MVASGWISIHPKKNERSTLINITKNSKKSNRTEFLDEIATSINYAQGNNTNLILIKDYDLNYLDYDEGEPLDTIVTPYNLEVANKSTPTHSKSLID